MASPPPPTPDRKAAAAASREIPASAASRDTKKPTDSVPIATGTFAALPARFGRYQVEKLLGRGMMGAVYLARDTQLDRLVALKIPRVSASGSAKLLKRLEVEAKAAAKLHHPNICSVYDYGVLDDVHFIALQYVEGQDLKSWLKRRGRPLAPAAAIRLMTKLAGAVGEAHRQEIIHRDLKPENIMLKPDGEPVIMDFGLARRASGATDAGLTQGMIVGTALYMSPEQANGRAEGIDHRSDIYALGVMLYELLTGAWPFSGTAFEVMGQKTVQEPPTPLDVDANLPPRLAAVCHKMIARKKENRYATCAEVVAALEAIDLNAPDSSTTPPAEDVLFDALPQEPGPMPFRRKSKKPVVNIPAVMASLKARWSKLPPGIRWASLGGAGFLSVALGVLLFFQTPYGVLQIEIEDPALAVKFDGKSITVDNDGKPIRVTPTAEHTLEVLRDGATVGTATRQVTLKRNEKLVLKISLIDGEIAINGQPAASRPSTSPDFFNGHDLTGWQGLPGHWSVENGEIVGRCAAGQSAYTFLVSDKDYKDFDLTFEARRRGGDSSIGVQFRSWIADRGQFKVYGPQCDIATPNGVFPIGSLVTEPTAKPLAEKAKPDAVATCRRNEFNRIRIRCIGKHATVWVNDVISVDGEFPLPDEGRIAWPIDGGAADHEIVLRNIEFTDLSAAPSTADSGEGFVSLFNGKDFSGWGLNGRSDAFAIDADRQTLVMKPSSPVSRLQTDRDYENFHLRFEFRIDSHGARSGVNIRMPSRAEGILPALKIQVSDDSTPYSLSTGGVYYSESGWIKRSRDDLRNDFGAWNRMEIVADGSRLQVSVNGKTCIDTDLQQLAGQNAIPTVSRTAGRIAFNADLGEVWFRKIEIRETTKKESAAATTQPAASTKSAADSDAEEIARLKQCLLDYRWNYVDSLYPPGGPLRFYPNGKFDDRWRWNYWVVAPRTMHVQFWESRYDPKKAVVFRFNEDLTKFTATFNKHRVTGTRLNRVR
ncbi:family 16 glycoside hydrolase [Planctellipticum variicoloris]|uniref:family 16 glycoside hydrolase n=1 Tax=Planctellipticum variicoloris TaxID=3064265 RepID=UPI003013ED8D|nr:DUF1080 domain-containing protein [Planctomycetaceae bacterium SH412]